MSRRRPETSPLPRVKYLKDDPPLTGWVHGLPASDLEERYARGLKNAGREFGYQINIKTAFSLPGKDKIVDFMVPTGGLVEPTDVFGALHQWPQAQLKDKEREDELNEVFEMMPDMLPLKIIWFWKLETQDFANSIAREV